MKYTKEYLQDNKIVINCLTREDLTKCVSLTGSNLKVHDLDKGWNNYGDKICISLSSYSPIDYWKSIGYNYITSTELINDSKDRSQGQIYGFKVGDKVKIPTKKTADAINFPYEECLAIKKAKEKNLKFLYITSIMSNNNNYNLGEQPNSSLSTFSLSDLELYEEQKDKISIKQEESNFPLDLENYQGREFKVYKRYGISEINIGDIITFNDYKDSFFTISTINGKSSNRRCVLDNTDNKFELLPEKNKPINSWCVQVTIENREKIKSFINNDNWSYNIDAYYGIDKSNTKLGINKLQGWKDSFSELISTEEFYKKINYKPQEVFGDSKTEQPYKFYVYDYPAIKEEVLFKIDKIPHKKFDEKEHLRKPFNRELTIKVSKLNKKSNKQLVKL